MGPSQQIMTLRLCPTFIIQIHHHDKTLKNKQTTEQEDDVFDVNLLCAKAKIANKYTVYKSELNGKVLSTRLMKAAVRAAVNVPEVVIFAGDSRCVISALEMNTTKMKPFFHNRVNEIRNKIFKVASKSFFVKC